MPHCQNCMNDTELTAANDPDGRTFHVCQPCVSLVEDGEARCVAHARMGATE